MKFRVKNAFYLNGTIKKKDDVIEVGTKILKVLREMDVLGEPIAQKKLERATNHPKEKRAKKK